MVPTLSAKELAAPQTVCKCREEFVTVNNCTLKKFKAICHNDCQLQGVRAEEMQNKHLQYCWAMQPTGTSCRVRFFI